MIYLYIGCSHKTSCSSKKIARLVWVLASFDKFNEKCRFYSTRKQWNLKLKGKYILRRKATQLLLSNMTAMTESCTTVRDLWWWCTWRRVKRIRRRWNESCRWCRAVAGTAANLQKCLHTYMNSIHLQSIESNGRVIVKDWNVIRMMTMVMAYVALARIAQMPGASSTSSTPGPSSTIRWSATHTRAPE